MKWVAMEQGEKEVCGINIKDSFSANFADATMQAEHILNQAPVYILGSMTAQLQTTDTDCSRAWITHELDRTRVQFKRKHGPDKGFSIGYPEIIRAIASHWVVSGAKRNGLSA